MGLSIDRKKVIKGLEKCKRHECDDCTEKDASQAPWDCPAYDDFVDSAIALLKEHETKPMMEYDDGWDCPRCGLKLIGKTASGYPCDEFALPNDEIVKYCPVCGQAVKFDD